MEAGLRKDISCSIKVYMIVDNYQWKYPGSREKCPWRNVLEPNVRMHEPTNQPWVPY